ncbi:unnamed protein product, partial [Prorocentrum cordatum]
MGVPVSLARQAALVNATGDSGSVELAVPLGRPGEASLAQCVAGRCDSMAAPALRLEGLLAGLGLVHCLKLNIMGYELMALLGAGASLRPQSVCMVLLEEPR